jgi:GT2 family glycosyltransferase
VVRNASEPRNQDHAVSSPAVAVVLVHWERANVDDTVECLNSLAGVDYPRLSVILVNNGAPGLPEGRLRQAYPTLQIVVSPENRGFSGGNNLGIAAALRDGADLVLLLNNDTVVRPDLIRAMLPALRDPRVGVVGPVITYFDPPDRVWFAGGRFSRWFGYTFHTEMDERLAREYADRPVDFVTGCALLAKREVFERVGMLWGALFIYFEDAEFCLRAARAGYRSVLVGQPLVRHKVSASMGDRRSYPFPPSKGYYFGRNPLLMLRRNARGPWGPISLLGFLGAIAPYNALQCIAARNLPALRAYLLGLGHGIVGRTGKSPI